MIPGGIIAAELAGGIEGAAPGQEPAAAPSGLLTTEDFQETLYFLEEAELEVLRAELDREWARDLRLDVLHALFDRLEDGSPERQVVILGILHQLLPAFIVRGDLGVAAVLLHELEGLLQRDGLLGEEARREAAVLLDELNTPIVLEQLIHSLEAGDIDPGSSELSVFLSHLGPAALPALLRTAELTAASAIRARLEPAPDQLGFGHLEALLALLGSSDEAVAIGAARVAGRLRAPEAATALARLLARPSAEARLIAVEALVAIRSAAAVKALQGVLEDPIREVRIAAARGIGALRYQPARPHFEDILDGRAIREADLTEKLAFFEAYASLAGADGVPLLERLLAGRGLLGRRHPPEIRACAATALGRIAAPAARTALDRARDETDPVVRGAIVRALRQEPIAP
jgi:HEAT repeat protein